MKTILILIGIVAAVTVCILLRFVSKRVWLVFALKRFAEKHGYQCQIPLSCLLPSNRNDHLVVIETGHIVYAVKLFGLLRKHCHIHFWSAKEYSMEWYFSRHGLDLHASPFELLAGAKRRSLGSAHWPAAERKEVIPLLLISPAQAPVMLTKSEANHWEHLRAGEKIGDVLFADLDFLFRFIENKEQ